MRIILEGPDNSGKTTLARLVTGVGSRIRYFHPGGRPGGQQAEMDCMTQQSRIMSAGDVLIDRVTSISQQVYSPSEDAEVNYWRERGLEDLLNHEPVVIYCRPSTDRLMRTSEYTWREGESEEFKQEIIRNAHTFIERYDKLMQRIPNLCYDFEDVTGNIIRTKLISACRGSQTDMKWFYDLMYERAGR